MTFTIVSDETGTDGKVISRFIQAETPVESEPTQTKIILVHIYGKGNMENPTPPGERSINAHISIKDAGDPEGATPRFVGIVRPEEDSDVQDIIENIDAQDARR